MVLTEGQTVGGRYCILASLGKGGMGQVYHARHVVSGAEVALKQLLPPPGLDGERLTELREQFAQEASVLARLEHPYLVRVIDVFEESNTAFLVMTYVAGESLDSHIRRFGALAESQVLVWAQQLLEALAYCHSQGIIHRDIKPHNVLIRADGCAVLADFGLVDLWIPGDGRALLRGMGTPVYAPPEQWAVLDGQADPRSDLYSLGATLYHALTGQLPPTAKERRLHPSAFRPPRALNRRVSPQVEAVLLRAMELPVERRFGSAEEMMAALRAAVMKDTPTPPAPLRVRSDG